VLRWLRYVIVGSIVISSVCSSIGDGNNPFGGLGREVNLEPLVSIPIGREQVTSTCRFKLKSSKLLENKLPLLYPESTDQILGATRLVSIPVEDNMSATTTPQWQYQE
jgi:hypothetical protein